MTTPAAGINGLRTSVAASCTQFTLQYCNVRDAQRCEGISGDDRGPCWRVYRKDFDKLPPEVIGAKTLNISHGSPQAQGEDLQFKEIGQDNLRAT